MNILIRADNQQSRAWIEEALSDYSLTLFSVKTHASMLNLLEHTHLDAVIFATPLLYRESLSALATHAAALPVIVCCSRQVPISELINPIAHQQSDAGKVFFIDDRSMAENRFKIEVQRAVGKQRPLSTRACPE